MFSLLKKLWRDRRGNVLVITAAAMPLIIGSAGIATDTIQWTLWKRELQRAADSAAIAGVYTRVQTDTQTAVEAAVTKDISINNHALASLVSGYPKTELLNNSGDQQKLVKVTLKAQKSLPFSSMFMMSAPVITATATAASIPGAAEYCVVALDSSASAIGINIGGSTTLDMGACSLIANSKNPNEAASNGGGTNNTTSNNSSVTAHSLAAAGGVQESASWHVDSYDPYSTPVADPFGSKAVPTSSMCTKNLTNVVYGDTVDRKDIDTNSSDIICLNNTGGKKGLTVQGDVVLGKGTYVVNGGDLVMNSTGSRIKCDGCTIIMTDFSNPANTGNIKLTGGTLDIKAPTSSTSSTAAYDYKGMALFQDKRATDTGRKTQNQINGNSSGNLQGAVYVPNQSLLYNGGGNASAACLQIVAKRTEFSGNSKIKVSNECAAAGISPIGSGSDSARKVRLVA